MAGAISSLGIGSGVLTADVIDKLKEADKNAVIKPIENKIKYKKKKKQALDLLSSLMTTLKASTSELADDTIFLNRTVSGTNDGINVTAHAGTAVQDFRISDVVLATQNVQESGSFGSEGDPIMSGSGSGSLNINVAGKNYTIDYDSSMTLTTLKKKINEEAGEAVTASILQTGDNAYSLIVKSKETGKDQNITITDNSGKLDTRLFDKTYKSDTYSSKTAAIASGGGGDMTLQVGSTTATIAYTDGMTLEQLRDAINDDATLEGKAVASIVEESSGNFRLVINPIGSEDGKDVTITDNGGFLDTGLTTNATNTNGTMQEIQSAGDASFKYDGIALTRSSNTIEDLIVGVKIELKSNGASANISITQDRDPIAQELENFVNAYNSMIKELGDMTTADVEEGKKGVFFGNSDIRNLGREITKLITYSDANGNSLANFGIDMSEDGQLKFDRDAFDAQMDTDPDNVMSFFSGKTLDDKGVFDLIDEKLENYTKFETGILAVLDKGIKKEQESLQENYTRSMELLNSRYDSLTERFIAYDAIISKLNAQFSSLEMQIQAAIHAKD